MPRRPSLQQALDRPDSKARYVRRLFATIADRYDLITVLLSFGLDRRWKQRVVALAGADRSADALDLACGTGDIAFELSRRGARVTGLDITLRMLQLARLKPQPDRPVRFLAGDMLALPFRDARFDIVTTGYGLRNVVDLPLAIDEIHRVLEEGGRFVSLDFNRPANAAVRAVYIGYLTVVGSALGLLLHRDPDTYRYIPASIRRYPGAGAVTALLEARGFKNCRWLPILGGLMAIHVATKAGSGPAGGSAPQQ